MPSDILLFLLLSFSFSFETKLNDTLLDDVLCNTGDVVLVWYNSMRVIELNEFPWLSPAIRLYCLLLLVGSLDGNQHLYI